MVEQYRERLRQLNPQQLNGEMRRLYQELPVFDLNLPENLSSLSTEDFDQFAWNAASEFEAARKRREKSQHKEILMESIAVITCYAPITNSFRQFIIDEFSETYDRGRGRLREDVSFFHILDVVELQSAGIFDPERAQEVEQRCYRQEVERYARIRRVLDEQIARLNKEQIAILDAAEEEAEREHGPRKSRGETLEEWRQEFIDRYGDEP